MSECRRFQLLAMLALCSLLLAACFRDTSEAIQQQPVAREAATEAPPLDAQPEDAQPEEALPSAEAESATEAPAATTDELAEPEPEADRFALTATALIARQTQLPATSVGLGAAADGASQETIAQATAIPLPRATIPPGEDCVHEIRVGDTLFQLSLAYGVTVDQIAIASGIANPDRIGVGQHVTIPECGTTGFIPPATSFPTATQDPATLPPTPDSTELAVAAVEESRSELVQQAQASLLNNAQTEAEAGFSAQLAPAGGTYTVQQNDTLFEIALRFGTSVEALASMNGIANVDDISAGDILSLP